MWYHDHAHGITRTNAYAGLATGYLILDLARDTSLGLTAKIPSLNSTIPLVVQDKIFNTNGSLFYETTYDPSVFRLLRGGSFLPPPEISAIPEFFGDTILVNGTVYPYLEVEPKPYRFLMLNATNARFLNLNLLKTSNGAAEIITSAASLLPTNATAGPPLIQIGTEGGYLVSEVRHPNNRFFNSGTLTGNMLLGPAERSDFIIDFTGQSGQEFILYNDAPGPFPGGGPTDFFKGGPNNPAPEDDSPRGPDTRQILKIKVTLPLGAPEPVVPAAILNPMLMDPPPLVPYTTVAAPIPALVIPSSLPVAKVRDLTLNEGFDEFGRLKQMVGTTTPGLVSQGFGLDYLYPATEVVKKDAVEVWRIFNLTADTHPMHFHLVNVQVISRQPFKLVRGKFTPTGIRRGPEPEELGWKETVKMHRGEVITVIMKFELPNTPFTVPTSPRVAEMMGSFNPAKKYHEYVWHCHILEHEEHDMMRPLVVEE
jgi:spore coat protein A